MIEILTGGIQSNGELQKGLWDRGRFKKWIKFPLILQERPAEFHDIKEARWKFPPGFSILLSPCRVTSSPACSLSIHHFLSSLI
jgi:hypothetical protein